MANITGSPFNDNNTVNGIPPLFRPALIGTNFNDVIRGLGGNDIIRGRGGNDWIDGGFGVDDMDGGAGIDTLDVRFWSGPYHLNMTTGVTNYAGETATNFENVYTGSGHDRITGTAGNNYINTGAGNDTVYAGSGNDTVVGGAGNDSLYGQNGNDRIWGGLGNDWINGGFGLDRMDGGAGIDTLDVRFWNGAYHLNMNTGVTNFAGETAINFERVYTGGGHDRIIGTAASNLISSGAGNDWLSAGGGNDTVYAGAGNDTLYGSTGNDTLNGGTGNDVIVGGTGNDTLISGSAADRDLFRFNSINERQDRILDFDTAGALQDVIQVRNSGFNPAGGAVDLFNGVLPANRLVGGLGNLGNRAGFRYFQGSGNLYFDRNGGAGLGGSQLLVNINGAAGGLTPPTLAQLQGNIQVI